MNRVLVVAAAGLLCLSAAASSCSCLEHGELTAEQAKGAVLRLIQSNPTAFFDAPDPERLGQCPLIDRGDDEFSFGAIVVNVRYRSYSAHIGGKHWVYFYSGAISWQNGRWVADLPYVQHAWD
ncbi:MAG: hypothetical protein HYR85_16810 [Planctomycetes bacterium]|nr:hypothetical protein [Planctomycetota bacterium]MBI3843792.1 hypothetical protein [Planctomycetota bacterium]